MTAIENINQGESLEFEFDRDGRDITGWVCNVLVKEFPSDTPYLGPAVVEPTGKVWEGFLTSDQTSTLPVGKTYRLYAILTDGTTDEEEQVGPRFKVGDTWA